MSYEYVRNKRNHINICKRKKQLHTKIEGRFTVTKQFKVQLIQDKKVTNNYGLIKKIIRFLTAFASLMGLLGKQEVCISRAIKAFLFRVLQFS